MNKITVILFALTVWMSCKETPKVQEQAKPASFSYFGDSISNEGAISVSDALASLSNNDSIFCAITGYVTNVCQVKGCWMMLSQSPEDSTGFFVKFKDYAFFVPKDLKGKVTVKGVAYKEVTPVDELKHYAEDEGKSKEEIEAITQPQEEMKFMADGVMVGQENK